MDKRRSEVAMIVGEEMADELQEHFKKIERGGFADAIVIKDAPVEFLTFPNKNLAGFECEYCRNTFVVDLLNQAVKCPGCDHGAPYEAVLLALNPIQKVDASYSPNSGSYAHPDSIRYGMVTGSHPHADTIRFSQALMCSPPRIPEPYPRIGTWKGEFITDGNRARIYKEMEEHYGRKGKLIAYALEGL